MALGVFTISKNGRVRLAIMLRALLILQLVFSITMIIFCYNAAVHVLIMLKDVDKFTVLILYVLILMQAYCMKLHYTSGLRLVTWIVQRSYWCRTDRLCKTWMLMGSLVAINGLFVCFACNQNLKGLMKSFTASLKIGISHYLTEPTWKKLLDMMQVGLRCCGIEKAKDWYEIPWINMDFLNEDNEVVMKLAGADGKVLPPVAPFSCCTPNILAPCYHDPLQQLEWHDVWLERETLAVASLHPVGCMEAVRIPLTRAQLFLQWFNGLVFLLQVFILFLTQLLRSSARDAIMRGDPGGLGVGCFIGRSIHKKVSSDRIAGEAAGTSVLTMEHRHRRRRRKRARTPSFPYLS